MRRIRFGKYNAKPTVVDGRRFASQAEADYSVILNLLVSAGEASDLQYQPRIQLTKYVAYIPDFSYILKEDGKRWFLDVKGYETPEFNIKKRLWKQFGPGPLLIVQKCAAGFKTKEVVRPDA